MDHFDKYLEEAEFVALDTETTGLKEGSRLVEIAALRFCGGEVIDTFPSQLINPGIPIPPRVSEIHKITDGMVATKPPARDVLDQFFQFCQGAYLTAHNAYFDMRMIAGEVDRIGWDLPPFLFFDTCRLARKWIGELDSYRLVSVARHFDLEIGELHRAFEDARLVMKIFQNLCSLAESTVEGKAQFRHLLRDSKLLDLSRPSTYRRRSRRKKPRPSPSCSEEKNQS